MGKVLHKVKEVECSPHSVHQMNRRDTTVKREANNGPRRNQQILVCSFLVTF